MFKINERTSGRYTAVLRDADGELVPSSALETLRLTLYDVKSGAIVNSRDSQNVLNMNGVTVYETLQTDAEGVQYNVLWQLTLSDTPMVDTAAVVESKVAVFAGTWAAGARGFTHRLDIEVQNLPRVS